MSFFKRKSTIAIAVVLVAILIGSYGYVVYQQQQMKQQQQELAAKQGEFQKTFTYLTFRDAKVLGWPRITGKENRMVAKESYEGLVRYEGNSTDPKPALAERWEISSDGLVYTFYLRKDVKFYPSGDSFDATVAKWNLDDMFRPGTLALTDLYGGPKWVQYDHTEIVDNYTVKMFIKRPLAFFIDIFPFVAVGGIVNPKWINAHGGSPSAADKIDAYMLDHQDVTGPYIVEDFKPSDRIVMKRNPTYWMGWAGAMANRPERFVIRLIPEPATRLLLLARGDADMGYVDFQYLPELRNRIVTEHLPLVIDESPTLRDLMVTFDHFHAPTNDTHVRRALAWSFNYDQYIKNIMFGFGDRMISFVPKGMWGYQPDVPYYTFDLDKAKAELALASPENRAMLAQGIKITYTPGYAIGKEGYLMWKSDLAKIGVNLIIDEVAYSKYRDIVRGGGAQLVDAVWSPDFPDPATFYVIMGFPFYITQKYGTTPAWINDLFEKAAFEIQRDQRLKIYRQVEEWAYDQVPYIKIASVKGADEYNVRGAWIKGYQPFIMPDHKPYFYELSKVLPTSQMPTLNLQTLVGMTRRDSFTLPEKTPSSRIATKLD